MRLPVRPLIRPSVLAGAVNGKLSRKILDVTPGVDGGADVTLVPPAGRAWRAMVAAARSDGIDLKVASPGRSYRPHGEQDSTFRARYRPVSLWRPGAKRYQGQWWVKKSAAFANAAVPGTSNHGWGLAVDIGEELDGDPGTESISTRAVQWLIDNAARFGWSAEDQSERWHWRYVAGDAIPTAVLEFERGTHTNPPAPNDPEEDDTMILLYDTASKTWRVSIGEGSAAVDDYMHWAEVIKVGKVTGVYASPWMDELIAKIRAERR